MVCPDEKEGKDRRETRSAKAIFVMNPNARQNFAKPRLYWNRFAKL